MKIPVIAQLDRSDFPDAPNWLTKLLYPLQLFMTVTLGALNKQITFQDNISCVVQQFSIVAGASDSSNTFSFPFTLGRQPVLLTIHATNGDGNYTPVYPVASWNYIDAKIVINGISGLTSGRKYNLTVTVA